MVMRSRFRKELELTQKDQEALVIIYHNGSIATGHLLRLIWQNDYGYSRISMLRDSGYITCEPYKEIQTSRKPKKISSLYNIDDKGFEYLKKVLPGPLRFPWKNKLPKEKYNECYRMGELRCQLLEKGVIKTPQQWLPSRVAKSKYKIKSQYPLHSLIIRDDGFDVFFFVDDNSHSRRIKNIRNVIPKLAYKGARKFILVCEQTKMNHVLDIFTGEEGYQDHEIYCIQYGIKGKAGIDQLNNHTNNISDYLADPNLFYREMKDRLEYRYGSINLIQSESSDPSRWMFFHNNQKIQVVELISGSLKNLDKLMLKAPHITTPELLYVYVPSVEYYHLIKKKLPEKRDWLRVIVKNCSKGHDIFTASK